MTKRKTKENKEDAAIARGIARDPDTFEPDDAALARLRPAAEVVPRIVAEHRRTRGPQKTPVKERITIRLDADVVDFFRQSGRGWQGRINAALAKFVDRQRRRKAG
jgi:uncharacterized protein (DUF4415 family)